MNKNIIYLIVGLVCICVYPERLKAQNKGVVAVQSKIVDESGKPIVGALVFSGNKETITDQEGKFALQVEQNAKITIEAIGYQNVEIVESEIDEETKLLESPLLYDEEDLVNMPFRQVKKGDIVGAANSYNMKNVNEYDNTIWLNGALSGRALGMLGSNNVRGLGVSLDVGSIIGTKTGTALVVVDGMPRELDGIRLSDIESITVLRDVNSAILYGSAAMNGVVMVTTKRGQVNKRTADISVDYGISFPKANSKPEYLGSAEYMEYYNQARINDGLEPAYSEEMINNYRYGNKYRYPNVDYYSSEYLKSAKSSVDLNAQFSGGDDRIKYLTDLAWNSQGSIFNFGEGKGARSNNINVRANIDLKINSWMNTAMDVTGLFYNDKTARGNFWGNSSTYRPFEFTPLLPISMIDPENTLLIGRKRDIGGKYLIGGNSQYQTYGIADGYAAGKNNNVRRTFSFNNRINMDLSKITPGLSFHTNFSFDYFIRYNQATPKAYSVYEPIWGENDQIVGLKQHGKDSNPGTQNVESRYFTRRMGFYGLLSYDRTFNKLHHVTGSLLGYGTTFKDNDGQNNDFQGVKSAHAGLQLGYIYDRKYMVDFSGALVNSVKLPKSTKVGFSPSVALAWVLSREDFFNKPEYVDYLKLKASIGVLKSDLPIGDYYYYDNRYTTSGSYNWYEGSKSRPGVISSWEANPNLNFATRKEVNVGFDAKLFKTLGMEANYFYNVYDGLVVRPTTKYPTFYGNFVPYENFEKDAYQGFELGINYEKQFGNWSIYAGFNVLYSRSKRLTVNEYYADDYQYRKGYGKDATFGLEALGFFQSQDEINNSPEQTFGTVRPGDLKYKDQNGDNIIDSRDEVFLRNWQSPWSEGLEIRVEYKNLSLFLLGEGQQGAKNFRESSYYWMDANDKYSVIARECWTPETKNTAKYPRLSSQANPNNLRRSSFWLYDNSYFNLRRVQLNYQFPLNIASALYMKDLVISLYATDLFQIGPNIKERDLRVGVEPYYRTVSVSLKAKF